MRSLVCRRLGALLAVGLLILASPARAAGDADAETLFNRGLAEMEAGHYETGCKAIAESQRLDPRAGTLFTLATCEARWGRVATAFVRFGEYLALHARLTPEQQERQGTRVQLAVKQREKLAFEVPQLTLSLAGTAPPGTVIKRDGAVVAASSLGVAIPIDPGEHLISVQPPGGPLREQRLSIGKKDRKLLTLTVDAEPAPGRVSAPSPAPISTLPPPPHSRSPVGPLLAFGAGAVGLGVGLGLGVAVLGRRADLDKACVNQGCPVAEQGTLDDAKTLSHASTAGFVVAAAGAAAGAVLLALPAAHSDRTTRVGLRLGAGHLGVEGTF